MCAADRIEHARALAFLGCTLEASPISERARRAPDPLQGALSRWHRKVQCRSVAPPSSALFLYATMSARCGYPAPDFDSLAVVGQEFKKIKLSDYKGLPACSFCALYLR